jgi:hypothetical protein
MIVAGCRSSTSHSFRALPPASSATNPVVAGVETIDNRAPMRLNNGWVFISFVVHPQLHVKDRWARLPTELVLRQIKVSVDTPGFRTKGFYIITLLDAAQYPTAELAELYFSLFSEG